jgi:putative transposase
MMHESWRPRMHSFLGGCVRTTGSVALEVGGTADHVHLLVSLKATQNVADLLKEIKQTSSHWVHEELGKAKFSWQEGYGAFTVSPSQIEVVRDYIANQETHHHKQSYQEEYLEFLKESGIDFDPRYLW